MAKIWYVREGSRPNNSIAGPELSLDQCIRLFSGFKITYCEQEPPESPSNRNDLTEVRNPNYVCIEIDSKEATQNKSPFDKAGFYFVFDLRPDKARDILEQDKS